MPESRETKSREISLALQCFLFVIGVLLPSCAAPSLSQIMHRNQNLTLLACHANVPKRQQRQRLCLHVRVAYKNAAEGPARHHFQTPWTGDSSTCIIQTHPDCVPVPAVLRKWRRQRMCACRRSCVGPRAGCAITPRSGIRTGSRLEAGGGETGSDRTLGIV